MTRKEARETVKGIRSFYRCTPHYSKKAVEALDIALEALQERPKGRWIDGVCSRCGHDCGRVGRFTPDYCESCGADMRESE